MNSTPTTTKKVRILPNQQPAPVVAKPGSRKLVRVAKRPAASKTPRVAASKREATPFVSPIQVRNTSKTAIRVDRFNTMLDGLLTDRDVAGLRAIKAKHGGRQFERGDWDAGIIRRLGERGKLEAVGDKFRLTRNGLTY